MTLVHFDNDKIQTLPDQDMFKIEFLIKNSIRYGSNNKKIKNDIFSCCCTNNLFPYLEHNKL